MTDFPYTIRRSARASRLSVTVYHSGEVKVTAPPFLPTFLIGRFISKKKDWISRKREHFLRCPIDPTRLKQNHLMGRGGRREFLAHRKAAHELVSRRLTELNTSYGLIFKRISIRNQKTRWGSCSHSGTLSFNYRIIFLEPAVQDYLLVHELCHLKHMNHSPAFWELVARMLPDWRTLRNKLKKS